MKKFISLFLMFFVLALSGNIFAKERKGAELIIQKTGGTQVRGELIAVKGYSLLVLERESGADMSIDIEDVRVITILKKLNATRGALYGFLIGAGVGAVLGYAADPDAPPSREATAAIAGISVGLIGALIGLVSGTDETIQLEGKSDAEIQEILEKLSKEARIKNVQ
ncbi:MAG: hypothetical protein OEY18_12030 [Candidatus Aminicenantes bacterium]|nr:hypothetical protein [Candidatus Aminicenantes bacterium]MDH5385428.1 hypothetical protein [Candidatus Aminicenantes bacterium]MDH5744041.1 hypothetical protein [Candidatus Aminicenantes bacterium]